MKPGIRRTVAIQIELKKVALCLHVIVPLEINCNLILRPDTESRAGNRQFHFTP